MINKKATIIGEEPILQLGFYNDETDELTKACVFADNEEKEVKPSPLSPEEKARLTECEKEIDENLEGFIIVGQRLTEIKTKKLFREHYGSFHQYCLDKFGFGRSYAKRVIEASKCVENLKSVPIGTVCTPSNESQARVLSNLSRADQIKVAEQTKKDVADKEATTKDFEKAKKKVIPTKAAEKEKPAESKCANKEVIHLPADAPRSAVRSGFMRPAEFHRGVELKTLRQLSDDIIKFNNIRSDSTRKMEQEKLLLKVTSSLRLYAQWEEADFGAIQQQEAA